MSTTEQITLTAVGSDDDASAKKPINAALSFSQGGTYHISLKVPSAAELEDLHLTFLREGTSTRVIQALAQKTTEQLQCVALQDGVEARSQNSELRKDWERVRQLGGRRVRWVIEGDRRLHAIPFEFVLPAPYGLLAEDISIVRKLTGYAPPEQRHATKQLQVLLVISRPWGRTM